MQLLLQGKNSFFIWFELNQIEQRVHLILVKRTSTESASRYNEEVLSKRSMFYKTFSMWTVLGALNRFLGNFRAAWSKLLQGLQLLPQPTLRGLNEVIVLSFVNY